MNAGGAVKTVNCYESVCCAVMSWSFQVKCWGQGARGRLGVGTFNVGSSPQSMGTNLSTVNLGADALEMVP